MSDLEMETVKEQPAVEHTPAPEAPKKEVKLRKNGKPKKTLGREILEWVITLAVALVVAFVVRSFLFEPVKVDGNSMYPTLKHGEIMFVSKTSYGTGSLFNWRFNVGSGEPERFDVIVCKYPDREGDPNFVKRIVGLPGDTVEIKQNELGEYTLYVNGKAYNEKFLHEEMVRRSAFGPVTLGEGEYFVLGDNRNNSNDSRNEGPITREMIVGRVEAVIWHDIPATLEDSGLRTTIR